MHYLTIIFFGDELDSTSPRILQRLYSWCIVGYSALVLLACSRSFCSERFFLGSLWRGYPLVRVSTTILHVSLKETSLYQLFSLLLLMETVIYKMVLHRMIITLLVCIHYYHVLFMWVRFREVFCMEKFLHNPFLP